MTDTLNPLAKSQMIGELMRAIRKLSTSPATAYAVISGSDIIASDCFDHGQTLDSNTLDANTLFSVASISKLITGCAVLQLVEKSLIDLDTDINQYIDIRIQNPHAPDYTFTVRSLLMQRAGIHDYQNFSPNDCGNLIDLKQLVADMFCSGGTLSVRNKKGTDQWYHPSDERPSDGLVSDLLSYWYSNAGFVLLGYIVEKVSGMKFYDYVQQNVFNPLSIHSARWFKNTLDGSTVLLGLHGKQGTIPQYDVREYPACQLRISLNDLIKFLMEFTSGSPVILSTPTINLMCPPDFRKGLVWWGEDAMHGSNDETWMHGGRMPGIRTHTTYYPKDRRGIILLTNSENDYRIINFYLWQA
jgi:CubicO group peptidase (beta-lactamase class C family)